ncbi:geranylgeranyl reductase family protein [Neolewinella xylanilytica]|uniref:Geranylgeranyl reductase family protein n=1 Tax=Neolewinella xylanilytica TaxID=1514080 RepID=A0A2S6I4H9_9BACT|nr:geranylgeranyl reductase family protein [Neolewinella xylanilytica]PPK86086.1 geranylgeranyl reductase family protein [Neolewinella xylanilytica]
MKSFDVVIVGAGPAGCAAALELGKSGTKVLLLDRDHFPRDKVCGDAIPGPAVKALGAIRPDFGTGLAALPTAERSRRTRLHLNGHRPVELHWETRAYTCRRTDFDNYLLGLVRQYTATTLCLGSRVTTLEYIPDGVVVESQGNGAVRAKLVIGADGAHSAVGKQLAGNRLDLNHHGGAVRQYYRAVQGMEPDRLEIHTLPAFMPGYFWVFPLADGHCNVGFGMHSGAIKRSGIQLRSSIAEFIQASPELRGRFAGATPLDTVRGFGLPFGSRRVSVAGERYLLAGDAASLVDPLTGDGIGQAILSGTLAANAAVRCLGARDCSATMTSTYTTALRKAVGRDLHRRSWVLAVHSRFPFLVDWGARLLQVGGVNRLIRPYL